jgi:hypothetical protein
VIGCAGVVTALVGESISVARLQQLAATKLLVLQFSSYSGISRGEYPKIKKTRHTPNSEL